MSEKFPLALNEGAVLAGQYIIEKVLGQGGFGITYKAKDYKTGQSVAIKEFFPEVLAARDRTTVIPFTGEKGENYEYGKACFLQEAETLAQFIGMENIVRIHSYFEENGTAYFVMDFVEGISFEQYIKSRGGKISYEEAERVLIKVIEALAAVHSKGIVHRDVTPDNIYITNDGVVKLLDFGAARYSIGDKSRSLDVVLKHGFAPKEQYTRRGKQGPYTDVYTVGASFYFAITGKRPPDSIDRMEEDDLIPPSRLGVQIPEAKENAILTAMNVQPADRYKTMDEFRAALLNANVSQTQAVQPVMQSAPPMMPQNTYPQKTKKKWILPVCIGAAALIIGVIVTVVLLRKNDTDNNNIASSGSNNDYSYNDTSYDDTGNHNAGNNDTGNSSTTDNVSPAENESTACIAGDFEQTIANNISNGGWYIGRTDEAWFYYPSSGLCYLSTEQDAECLDPSGEPICNINPVGNGIIYTREGIAYMETGGECYILEDLNGIDIQAMWANDVGVFFIDLEDGVYRLQYRHWQNGLRPYTFEVLSPECVTIMGDYIYLVTADGTNILKCHVNTALSESADWTIVASTEGHEFKKMVGERGYLYAATEYLNTKSVVRIDTNSSTGGFFYKTIGDETSETSLQALNVYDGVIYYVTADWNNYSSEIYSLQFSSDGRTIIANDYLTGTTRETAMAVYDICLDSEGVLWLTGVAPDYKQAIAYMDMNGTEFYDYIKEQ